jgi:dTDP-glucose 4,6-dehydratase
MSKRILVTGGAGFIGSAVARHIIRDTPHQVLVVDKLTYAGNLDSLAPVSNDPRYAFVRGDVADLAGLRAVFESFQPEIVMHLAAESHVDRSIDGPGEFIQTNVVGTFALLQATLGYWRALAPPQRDAFRFHHVSTDEVFGSLGEQGLFCETTAYDPRSPYSASKAASDHLVRAWHHTYGLPTIVTNCSNNYGPYHFPEKLIPLVIVNILEGRPLPIYGDGRNVRDWLFVTDHCRAIELVIDRGLPGETYNVGGRAETENIEIVRRLCTLADEWFAAEPELRTRFPACPAARGASAQSLITYVADRPGHDRRYAIDATKTERELSYAPKVGIADGLRATLRWYLDNEPWWRAVMDGSYRHWIATQYAAL